MRFYYLVITDLLFIIGLTLDGSDSLHQLRLTLSLKTVFFRKATDRQKKISFLSMLTFQIHFLLCVLLCFLPEAYIHAQETAGSTMFEA